jgi:phage terminase large subunit GpA-like protein
VLRWDLPKGRRNEALDCRCYATAARYILNPNLQALADRGVPLIPAKRGAARRKRRVVSKGAQ